MILRINKRLTSGFNDSKPEDELGYGSLQRKKGINADVLVINNFEGWLLVTKLINGHMRTPKIYALYRLIDWLNTN